MVSKVLTEEVRTCYCRLFAAKVQLLAIPDFAIAHKT
jgi:hypothetical protein